jgi:hypothetical protein
MRDCHIPTSSTPLARSAARAGREKLWFAALALLTFSLSPRQACAEDPARLLLLASGGVPLRLTLDQTYGQTRFAPPFGNVLIGYAFAGDRFRHGFGLGVDWNFGRDGGYTDAIYTGDQIGLMPAYLAYYTLNPDVTALGHAGIPFLIHGGPVAGFELGAAIACKLLAGAGVFAGIDLDAYGGGSFSLLASLELGIMIDYEVLP